jgi:hypothetical protein
VSGQPLPTPTELQSLPEESLGLVSLATELSALADSLVELARVLPRVPRSRWPGLIGAAAPECRHAGDAAHDVARYLEALHGPGEAPATRRDISLTTRRMHVMTKLRIASASIGAACLAVAGVAQFAVGYPRLAAGFLAAGTGLTALAVNLPAPKVTP